jgi:MSHA pilin protein MshA
MRRTQQGFTLIELVVVIVILGILAATAIPKFIDMSDDAASAAVAGVAGALSSAAATNYGVRKVNSTKGVAIANCTDVEKAMQSYTGTAGSGIPSGYTITAAAVAADATVQCTLTGKNSKTATFTAIGIS